MLADSLSELFFLLLEETFNADGILVQLVLSQNVVLDATV